MPKSFEERMKEKGWSEEEISHAMEIMYSKEKEGKHVIYTKNMNPILYWLSLIIAIIGNLFISIILIPFLLVLSSYQLYFVIVVLALTFGTIFNFLINAIEHIETTHHIIAGAFIPAIAVITVFVMVNVSNKLSVVFQSPIHQNPVLVSILYVVAFILPYGVTRIISYFKYERKPKSL